jgi:O-antigen/teichoic acid export membrane protein
MFGYALASAIVLGSQVWFFRRQILSRSPAQSTIGSSDFQNWTKQMRNYAWPFATWGLFTWAQMASDRWALQIFTTTSDVGMYAVLYQLGYYPITFLSGIMMQLVSPILFYRAGDGTDSTRIKQIHHQIAFLTAFSIGLAFAGTIAALILHEWFFGLLVAPEYLEVSWLLPWMVLAGGIFASGQLAVLSLLSGTKTRNLVSPKMVTALLGIILNLVGAKWFGLRGVVGANVTFSMAYLIWIIYLVRNTSNRLRDTD